MRVHPVLVVLGGVFLVAQVALHHGTHAPGLSLPGDLRRAAASVLPEARAPPKLEAATNQTKNSRVHVVFSTDCSEFMEWQALMLLDSAARVGQLGAVTRLVHGCGGARRRLVEGRMARETYPFAVHLHFTRDFNQDFHVGSGSMSPSSFRFANKPRGIHDWLEHHGDEFRANHAHDDEDILIVLIDPDFVFLRPVDLWTLGGDRRGDRWDDQATVLAFLGRPKAHYNGLGGAWLRFHRAAICGADSPCTRTQAHEIGAKYDAGPPYVAHWSDLRRIAVHWVDFTPKVWDDYPTIDGPNRDPTRHYAEMYAYVMAVAHLDLDQTLIKHQMVGCMVDWRKVDHLDAASSPGFYAHYRCGEPFGDAKLHDDAKLPVFVHYCQTHAIGPWAFTKRRVPVGLVFNYTAPDPPPPPDLVQNASKYHGGTLRCGGACGKDTAKEAKRAAFVFCILHSAIKGAAQRHTRTPAVSSSMNHMTS